MEPLMQTDLDRFTSSVSLREAAELLGTTPPVLKRLLRAGELPEAHKLRRPEGKVWAVPLDELPAIAVRAGFDFQLTEEELDDRWDATPTDQVQGESDVGEFEGFEILRVDDDGNATIESAGSTSLESRLTSLEGYGSEGRETPNFADVLDLALLDRLLGVQEQAVSAVADVERAETELQSLNVSYDEIKAELEAQHVERNALAEQFMQERAARSAAEARVAELKGRVARETALTDQERAATTYANIRSIRRERETAIAAASMGFFARRRFRRRLQDESLK